MALPEAAMLMWPSDGREHAGGNAGRMIVAGLAPAPRAPMVQRAAWKSSMAICAPSSELCTHWPSPDCSRSSSAIRMPMAAKMPAREIGDRECRRAPGLGRQAGDRHQPAHALRDLVEAGPVAIRAVLAEAGDTGIDEARIDGAQGFVIDAEAEFHVGPIVFHHARPRARTRAVENLQSLGALEVQRQAALVAVQILEIRAVPLATAAASPSGASTLMTSAPQSASCRTAVGPRARASGR